MSALIIDEVQGSGKFQISSDGMTGTRICRSLWANWPSVVLDLMGTPVLFGQTIVWVGRGSWPGIPTLQVETIEVEGQGKSLKSNWEDGPKYDFAKFTIGYKIPEFEDNKNEAGQPAQYLIESLDYSVELAVVPVMTVDNVDTTKTDNPDAYPYYKTEPILAEEPAAPPAAAVPTKATTKRHVRIPTITYTVTMPRLATIPHSTMQASLATVNKTKLFGGQPGTVLFDGPQADRESAFFSARYWRLTYKFIYQRFGWNMQLDPNTLKWVPAQALGAENAPYPARELRDLFPAPYTPRIEN